MLFGDFIGKTNSYKNSKDKNINLSDLFGLNINLNASNANWSFDSLNDLRSLISCHIKSGSFSFLIIL